MKILVTGGPGFIGSAVCRHLIRDTDHSVVNLDKLTYAASLSSLSLIENDPRYRFVKGDILDRAFVADLLVAEEVDAIMHLAAESHVDRSIDGPGDFIQTNIVGTYELLEAARAYWSKLSGAKRDGFRFHHISTDEVYGDLPLDDSLFTEETPYAPSSPIRPRKRRPTARHGVVPHLPHAVVSRTAPNNYGPYYTSPRS